MKIHKLLEAFIDKAPRSFCLDIRRQSIDSCHRWKLIRGTTVKDRSLWLGAHCGRLGLRSLFFFSTAGIRVESHLVARSRMNALQEPVGGNLMSDSLLFRFSEYRRANGGEWKPDTKIV